MFNTLIAILALLAYIFTGERFFLLALIPIVLALENKIDNVEDVAHFAILKADKAADMARAINKKTDAIWGWMKERFGDGK